MATIEALRQQWTEAARRRPFHPYLYIDDEGLSLGAGTRLAPMIEDSNGTPCLALDGADERLLALLSIAYGKSISGRALKFIKRASTQ